MKQPDRFEQMVEQVQRGQGTTNNRWYLYPEDVVKLLRCQYAEIRRRVAKQYQQEVDGLNNPSYNDACTVILKALDDYKKGTP